MEKRLFIKLNNNNNLKNNLGWYKINLIQKNKKRTLDC